MEITITRGGDRPGAEQAGAGNGYVHGYGAREAERLTTQADVLAPLVHGDREGVGGPITGRVLEAGCGTGAQTGHLLAVPGARVDAVDLSAPSLARARARHAEATAAGRVRWHRADVTELPFPDASFDHVFGCFVLEHLAEPARALTEWLRVLRPGGGLTVVEGDHGSTLLHPDSAAARAVIAAQARAQERAGGNAFIGRRLAPLLRGAGFREVGVEPRTVCADRARPDLRSGFVLGTFVPVFEAARPAVLAEGRPAADEWERGMADLRRTADGEGTFHYTFFRATARAPR
ncbi:methyltransferase domain-containing protein [Streptomyces calidiresistens]|uniref:Methyltransferase domain-containing protein n=1 Tax=Streptomyces calidiresistens TaxID=1485586 RepID=A0A7W3T645_9ACTN|nr:methyltransferase domain-containing protein [Streptomyces calidiresistens]MBB0231451.1 methyltransferase domain-containing protein [Streptomyces calidiresistens]